MRFLSIIFLPFFYIFSGIIFVILILPISILALPFDQPTRLKMTRKFWQLFAKIIIQGLCLCPVYKEDRRPKEIQKQPTPQGLYIANHQSFMDIPLMICQFQIPPIMKKQVLYIPIFGICGYAAGAMIVDRSKKDSRKKVFEKAKYRLTHLDKSLQYYPEGTRQRNANEPKSYEEIKKPIMEFAYEAGIPIFPISIYGTRQILTKKGVVNLGKKIGIILHDGLDPKNFSSKEEFMQSAWKKVQTGYIELAQKLN